METADGRRRTLFRDLTPIHQLVYVVVSIAALALVAWDIADGGAPWTTFAILGLIVVLVVIRPGGPLKR